MIDKEAWLKRADELTEHVSQWNYSETLQFATSMINAFYGPDSPQMTTFRTTRDGIMKGKGANPGPSLAMHAKSTIKNIQAEIKAGLISSVRAVVAGEMVADLLSIAKETLDMKTDSAKNVAAVLVAAAFEDTIRRMGTEFAGVEGRPKLEGVTGALKHSDVLKGGEVTTALGYLKFRNDSLHADWEQVHESQVRSCLAFVEALLVKHFS